LTLRVMTLTRLTTWLIHLLLTLLPLTSLVMMLCPECYFWMLDWIYSDREHVSERTRIVLWGSALLPSAIVYGYQASRLWLRLRQTREGWVTGGLGTQEIKRARSKDRSGRRVLYGVIANVGLVTALSTLLTGWPLVCWYHDFEMLIYSHSLQSAPLPEGSQVIATERRFGLLWGNSNHCDAQVMALLETTLDDARLSGYFEEPVSLWQPFSDDPEYLDVIKVTGYQLYHLFNGKAYTFQQEMSLFVHSEAPMDNLWEVRDFEAIQQLADDHTLSPDRNYYILIATDQTFRGYDMLDIRCH